MRDTRNTFPELKSGMLVKLENGDVGIVFNEALIFAAGGWMNLEDYTQQGQFQSNRSYDIVKVSVVQKGPYLMPKRWTEIKLDESLLWSLKPEMVKLELNNSYTAEISPETVTVGCQEFPISKIEEIIQTHKDTFK